MSNTHIHILNIAGSSGHSRKRASTSNKSPIKDPFQGNPPNTAGGNVN